MTVLDSMASSDEEAGWQWRLCAAICAPPIHKLHMTAHPNLQKLYSWAICLACTGLLRSAVINGALLGDFLSGGTDFFAALLTFCAVFDLCSMNGSYLVMFLVWAWVNMVLFDIIFSLLPNLQNAGTYFGGYASSQKVPFIIDNILICLNAWIQYKMIGLAKAALDERIPNWRNDMVYGQDSGGSQRQEPFLPRPAGSFTGMRPAQPPAQQNFQLFGGSGQRLGS
eukprot:TRINITY_DN23044_c0_g1_i3.p1 TRINITY_DN23044_c0_g1~~TRINITY_DN23044_c0_g1_i3.p1  ORF type:complete len:225 (+),score=14.41 TRINITY_DN23044_c0_g1_i3:44-718(+)